MSSSSLPPLHLDFVRAPARAVLCALTLLITIAAPALAGASYGVRGLVLAALAASVVGVYIQWRAGWLGNRYRVAAAVWDSEGQWWLTLSGRARMAVEISPASVAVPRGAWLIFNTEEGRKVFILISAAMFPHAYRRLLVRLRTAAIATNSSRVRESSDVAHVHAYLPRFAANFRRGRRSIRALMELPRLRAIRDETRAP